MSDTRELDDIIAGTEPTGEPEQETPEPAPEPETPEPAAAPPAAEKPPEPKDEGKPPPGYVPHQALAEERRKRQEYERQLEEFRKAAEAKPKPNLFEDPEQWEKALDERVESRLAALRQESEQRFLTLVEQAARARHSDFDTYAQAFAEAARETPALVAEARAAADPAEFIYTAGKRLSLVKEAGSLEELIRRAELRGEERARQARKPEPEIPESLTDIAGAGEATPKWNGPKALDQLLPTI